jgi:serine protease
MIRYKFTSGCVLSVLAMLFVSMSSHAQERNSSTADEDTVGGARVLEPGQPVVTIHATVDGMERFRGAHPNAPHGSTQASSTVSELQYHGGSSGVGVETAPKIYLIFWGSQWINGDPTGEAAILEAFYNGVGGSAWLNSVTQYCQGLASGTVFCNGAGTPAGNRVGILAGYWYDNASAAPSRPKQSQLAAEAARAAAHFGKTTATSNASVQYVIATAHGNNASGFGTQYCAWHSSSNSSYGKLAYTNLPYITDAGASCGANFNGLGPDAGITIVSGHEMAETITDQFPNTGWLDSSGAENGDKCAWISSGQGAAATIALPTGTFAVQSLWSNAFNGDAGGCVLSY